MLRTIGTTSVLLALGLLAGCVSADEGNLEAASSPAVRTTAFAESEGTVDEGLYYIEFRARSAESYGHTFAMFGRRDRSGKILTREVAGLHPASTSDVPYVLGHLVPVPSETGPSDGDLEDRYMTARYRIDLNRREYEDVVGYIRRLQASSPVWHAVLYNCSTFVGKIANHMGLRAPNSLLFPKTYIETLRAMNT
ncbi:hypothetical protein [Antarcticirhabdus aurantiaca]|uniref:Uncharacterized protein n=1 Tax=Antarcticirhabdus aurantiaca TaxID=2606717 RepID=A0ACD4NWH3_9HYPH|nr:hypothetical protein [Antarcticirhabdus aurantiaca]WAJ31229.1 hypothetical protein OXU80_13935 [Jeongeuplla avenae]